MCQTAESRPAKSIGYQKFGIGQTDKNHLDIWPIPPLHFTGEGQKVGNFASIFDSIRLWRALVSKLNKISKIRIIQLERR